MSLFHTHTHTHTCSQAASCPVLQHASTSTATTCPPVAFDSWSQPSSLSHHFFLLPIIWLLPPFFSSGCQALPVSVSSIYKEEGSLLGRGFRSSRLKWRTAERKAIPKGALDTFRVVRHRPFWIWMLSWWWSLGYKKCNKRVKDEYLTHSQKVWWNHSCRKEGKLI